MLTYPFTHACNTMLYLRPIISKVIYRYLDCSILHNGFARIKYKACNHEYLLAFSLKRRHFCLSCHAKRVVEFGEWLCSIIRIYIIMETFKDLMCTVEKEFIPEAPSLWKIFKRYIIRASFS
jgi:hypothetical protein